MKSLISAISIISALSGLSGGPFSCTGVLAWCSDQPTLSSSTRRVWTKVTADSTVYPVVLIGERAAVSTTATYSPIQEDTTETAFLLTKFGETDYYYADIPNTKADNHKLYFGYFANANWFSSGTGVVLTESGTTTNGNYAQTDSITISQSSGDSVEMWNLPSIFPVDCNIITAVTTRSVTTSSTVSSIDVSVDLAAKVLEGLHTCDSSVIYGHGVINDFVTYYYNALTGEASDPTSQKGQFRSLTIRDYDYDENTGEPSSATVDNIVTCGAKMDRMLIEKNGNAQGSITAKSSISSSGSIWAAAIISIAAVAIFTSVIIALNIKNRKKDN